MARAERMLTRRADRARGRDVQRADPRTGRALGDAADRAARRRRSCASGCRSSSASSEHVAIALPDGSEVRGVAEDDEPPDARRHDAGRALLEVPCSRPRRSTRSRAGRCTSSSTIPRTARTWSSRVAQHAELLADLPRRRSLRRCRSRSAASIPSLPLPGGAARRRRRARPLRARRRACSRPAVDASLVPTGIAIAIPEGYAGFVQPRSGLALRHGVTCLNTPGLIDAGYRDEIRVLLVNTDPTDAVRGQARRPHRAARDPAGRARRVATRSRRSTTPSAASAAGARPAHAERRWRSIVAPCPRPQIPLRSHRAASTASGKEFTELARAAEALGYSTLFVPDHFVDHDLAPTVALAHAAAVTDTLAHRSARARQRLQASRSCSRARWRRSTCSPTAGSSSASARAG